jgi:Flp pilus assembly protein TadG
MSMTMMRGAYLIDRITRFFRDARGMAAVEFAIIVPMMLTIFFGTIEVSNGVAADRKVTLASRTLSDLVSQGTKVSNTDLDNFFKMSVAIMTPYGAAPLQQRVSAIDIDDKGIAKVAWSRANGTGIAALDKDKVVSVPEGLIANNTQLILAEVFYKYTPTVGYFMKDGVMLSDVCYTRPRQSAKVDPPPA